MTTNLLIMLHNKLFLLLSFVAISLIGNSLPYDIHSTIKWTGIQNVGDINYSAERLGFVNAEYDSYDGLPIFVNKFPIHTNNASLKVTLIKSVYTIASEKEKELINKIGYSSTTININAQILTSRKEPMVKVDFIPIRWNEELQQFEKLIEFEIELEIIDIADNSSREKEYSDKSVLNKGSWFKIKLDESGIYKVSYDELSAMGFDVSVHPSKIAVFGNGGGLLPEKNDEFKYDDLFENPIEVVGGDDGSFDDGDYILFYGEGPVTWSYNSITGAFYHHTNYYRDHSYYFITALTENAKRVETLTPPTGSADVEIHNFTDYAVHEIDERNIAGIGRTWFGEIFDYVTTYDFSFDFPNTIKNVENGYFKSFFASRAYSSNAFNIDINGNQESILNMGVLSTGNRYEYAKSGEANFAFAPTNDNLIVSIEFARSSNTSVGYLDYFEVNVQRNLIFSGDQMRFRKSVPNANIAEYSLQNEGQNISIWDISTPVNPSKVDFQSQGNNVTFKSDATTIKEFIAFNGNSYLKSEFVEEVSNQNLHGNRDIDYLIIAYPDFIEDANRLAEHHRTYSNMTVLVATVDEVYNEFSSGGQDITAIRNFAKMLYDDSSAGNELKYLLLFGDASYDYKDILPDNTNFVPCWESIMSLDVVSSIASDDYFGFLDDGEGVEGSDDLVDIGIGRFVVATKEESIAAVDKTFHYTENTSKTMAPWRNTVTFVGDDGDANRHIKDAERLATIFDTAFPVYNLSKIYVDAYEQVSTPSGQTAPAVNAAINERIEKGTLIFNYSGHGGEIGLGHERFLQVPDIQSWTNFDMLSVFITATCEFTRYDDPTRVSAGELVFLNPKGGGISLFTTSRATFAGSNLALNMAIYNDNMFKKIDGEYPTFGDIIRRSKLYGTANDKKFVLIGDPACRMAYPEFNAETTKINSQVIIPEESDTIKALQLVQIEGIVTDDSGNKLDNFNGELFSSVYDKKSEIITLGDDNSPYTFYVRNSIIFNGKASITNGDFSFEFMVPKDIAYKYGIGKISYYFRDTVTDGHGYYENIIVGGFDENAKEDTEGPIIELFMDDTTFISGDFTNQNPNLLAFVSDSSGINTTGSGIGHDIVTIINEDKELTYVLNDYYEADKNKYNQGVISYPFSELPEGEHSLSLKVWDVYNNSSIAYIDFIVVQSEQIVVENLMNYPNPFMSETNFVFDHNQAGNIIEVQLEIFSLDGRLVKKIVTNLEPEGHRSEPISWDGKKDNGGVITRGMYVYRVTVRNEAGGVAKDQSKLIYIR